MTAKRNILVTSALPYANGDLHLGHIMEAIQTDIWVRFQRLRGHNCYYVCADDAHGTPIMLKAQSEEITPEQLIEQQRKAHLEDYHGFAISFDNYYSTHSEYNREFSESVYRKCREGGHIIEKEITQAYDPEKELFLSDRFIRGTCPKCSAEDQYGDNCEQCGANYNPLELINPHSVLSGTAPIERESLHYFFAVTNFKETIVNWLDTALIQVPVRAKLSEWLDAGLKDWDISRDAPYFGFEIPEAAGKYFYVWLDAPLGYMAAWRDYCERNKIDFDRWWGEDSDTELYHFIGKDIINFHGLFWPALLRGAQYRLPTALCAHGFLTVNGEKMSKSRNTFILARDYLTGLDADYLRYYFAGKLDSSVRDIDLNIEDFCLKINSDLVGKIVNIASRCTSFILRFGDGRLSAPMEQSPLQEIVDGAPVLADAYEEREYATVVREVINMADLANRFIDEHKPWQLAKADPQDPRIQEVCSTGIALFRLLMIYLKPVVPNLVQQAELFLGEELDWSQISEPPTGNKLNNYQALATRIDASEANAILGTEASSDAD